MAAFTLPSAAASAATACSFVHPIAMSCSAEVGVVAVPVRGLDAEAAARDVLFGAPEALGTESRRSPATPVCKHVRGEEEEKNRETNAHGSSGNRSNSGSREEGFWLFSDGLWRLHGRLLGRWRLWDAQRLNESLMSG